MRRLVRVGLFALLLAASAAPAALAQAPGQLPGTFTPGSPIPPPSSAPPFRPPPVPSVVTPIPMPSFGVPPGVTRPVTGGSSPIQIYQEAPPPKEHLRPNRKKRPRKARRRASEILFDRLS